MKGAIKFFNKNSQKSNLHKFWNENMTEVEGKVEVEVEVERCIGLRV